LDNPWLIAVTDGGGNWHFGIGDPTPMGWFILFMYVVATVLAAKTWVAERKRRQQGLAASPNFWLVLTILLLFLGFNKQLDLQTLLQDTVRRMAKANNWYKARRMYQYTFIALVVLAGLAMLGTFSWLARKQWRRNFVALLGTVILYVFIFIRASSLHHVDIALQWRFAGLKWNWILELGGILVTIAGTIMVLREDRGVDRKPSGRAGPDDGMGVKKYSLVRGVVVVGPDKPQPPRQK
jgi:hypothetical protein